jgi:hypothetical protein
MARAQKSARKTFPVRGHTRGRRLITFSSARSSFNSRERREGTTFSILRGEPELNYGDVQPSERVQVYAKGGCGARRSTSKMWCGRRDLNPHGPFKPCGFSYRLRLSPPGRGSWRAHARFAVWTIPSPSPEYPELRCCPSSLYTFPVGISPGLARDCHLRFPRI